MLHPLMNETIFSPTMGLLHGEQELLKAVVKKVIITGRSHTSITSCQGWPTAGWN